MELAIKQDAIAETYADTENLIKHTVHRFVKSYGGRYDDLIEYVGPMFMTAYKVWDPRKGKFSTCLSWVVWKQLLDLRRIRSKRQGIVKYTDLDPELFTALPRFDIVEFMDQLSTDARLVAETALTTQWGFDPDPKTVRGLLREWLSQPALGWSQQRIKDSFREIRVALNGGVQGSLQTSVGRE